MPLAACRATSAYSFAGMSGAPLLSTHSPGPYALGVTASPRRRIDQQPAAGSHRYSSSLNPASRTWAISLALSNWSSSAPNRSVRAPSISMPGPFHGPRCARATRRSGGGRG
ncbi:hypothetical protein SVIOM342S_07830 [Streptomyces violaceorubidus]